MDLVLLLTLTGAFHSGCVFKRQKFELTKLHFLQKFPLQVCYIVKQHMHTHCQNYINVSIRQFVHISGLTGPSSGSGQLRKTIVRPYYLIIISSSWICALYINCQSYIDKLARVALRTGGDNKVWRLFYAIVTVHSLKLGQSGPKHVGVCV